MGKPSTVTARGLRLGHALIIGLYSTAAILLVLWFLIGWRVKAIAVGGCTLVKNETVAESASFLFGKHMYGFSEKALEKAIKDSSPYIRAVTLHRRPPSRLEVEITEHRPVGFTTENGKAAVISDRLEVVFDSVSEEEALSVAPCRLILPQGDVLTYPEQTKARLLAAMDALFSSPFGKELTVLDLCDFYDISAELEGGLLLSLGSDIDLAARLRYVPRALEQLAGRRGTVYVTSSGAVSFVPAD